MFGIFRLFLAILVVYTHLGPPHGSALGQHAVFGFYLLSGFLITRVLNERYQFKWPPFWINRFLRLYPIYFVVAVLSIPLVIFTSGAGEFNGRLRMPQGLWPWVQSFLVVPTVSMPSFRLVPVSWSIAVEIVNYAILAAFTARRPTWAWIALLAGIAVHCGTFILGLPHSARYYPFWSAVLPFTVGALTYFYFGSITALLGGWRWSGTAAICAYLGLLAIAYATSPISGPLPELVFYFGLIVLVPVVGTLGPAKETTVGKFLGDMAYPVFVCHIAVGALVHVSMGIQGRSVSMFLIASLGILLLSALLALMQSRFIEPRRDLVREHGA